MEQVDNKECKKRLKNEKESYNDRLENTYNAVLVTQESTPERLLIRQEAKCRQKQLEVGKTM